MAEPALDPRLEEYSRLLSDGTVLLSELELRRIRNDMADLALLGGEAGATANIIRGMCMARLGRPEQALEDFRRALQRQQQPTPLRAFVFANRAAALLNLRRYQEAADDLFAALRINHPVPLVALTNLAEALRGLGLVEDALAVFNEAVSKADHSSFHDWIVLANQAADIGLEAEALECFARFLVLKQEEQRGGRTPGEIIRSASKNPIPIPVTPALESIIRSAVAMDAALRVPDENSRPSEDPGARDAYEATRDLRGSAVAQVIGRAGNGEH